MARRRFLVSEVSGVTARLTGEDAHHLLHVLRVKPGQRFEVSDGARVWLAEVTEVGSDWVEFRLGEELQADENEQDFVLLLSIVKFDRFEWILEKATELGVTRIVPLAAERSVSHLVEAAPKRAARWKKILKGAAEQSRRVRPPELEPARKAADALSGPGAGLRVLLSESEQSRLLGEELATGCDLAHGAYVAVGPEGGWTEAEEESAVRGGYVRVSLGKNILRTETAALAALALVGNAREAGGMERGAEV